MLALNVPIISVYNRELTPDEQFKFKALGLKTIIPIMEETASISNIGNSQTHMSTHPRHAHEKYLC